MIVLGFVVLALAFLVFASVANNSWPVLWARLRGLSGSATSDHAQPGDPSSPRVDPTTGLPLPGTVQTPGGSPTA